MFFFPSFGSLPVPSYPNAIAPLSGLVVASLPLSLRHFQPPSAPLPSAPLPWSVPVSVPCLRPLSINYMHALKVLVRSLHSAENYVCLIFTAIPHIVSQIFWQVNDPQTTIAHHAVFAVASDPTKENTEILEGMCDAYMREDGSPLRPERGTEPLAVIVTLLHSLQTRCLHELKVS